MEGEELRGPELAEEGERLQTGVTLWCEPAAEGAVQTRAEKANKGTGVRQGPEPTDELRLEEQVVRKASRDP